MTAEKMMDPLVGLDERLDRLLLTSNENERFVLSTESAKNIVGIVREWLRSSAVGTGAREALEKIAGVCEYDRQDYEAAAFYKPEEGLWTVDEYLADAALQSKPEGIAGEPGCPYALAGKGDILEILRNYIPGENDDWVPQRIAEAADEIERLRTSTEALRRRASDYSDFWYGQAKKQPDKTDHYEVLGSQFRHLAQMAER